VSHARRGRVLTARISASPRPHGNYQTPVRTRKAALETTVCGNGLTYNFLDIELFQVVYPDFTEILYADGRWKTVLMPIIGHVSKMVFG
jgi:hypothetical protein